MILYTIVPTEIIFGNIGENSGNKFIEIEYMGEKVIVSPNENDGFVINRVISTSPQAYLNAKLQPGTTIYNLEKVKKKQH